MSFSPDFAQHYAALRERLQELRPLFSLNEAQSSYLAYFDEELEANEFEIALHALCSFLLEPSTPGIERSEIEKIEILHRKMDLGDGCAISLYAKSQEKGMIDSRESGETTKD